MKENLKAFSYCKDMDCGKVVASSREEAGELLKAQNESWPTTKVCHDIESVDYVYMDTHRAKGVYPVPYSQYGERDWDEEFWPPPSTRTGEGY